MNYLYTEVEILGWGGYQGNVIYGIMKTPCFPHEWYGGNINSDGDGWYRPGDNSTQNFFRTYDEALQNAMDQLNKNPIIA